MNVVLVKHKTNKRYCFAVPDELVDKIKSGMQVICDTAKGFVDGETVSDVITSPLAEEIAPLCGAKMPLKQVRLNTAQDGEKYIAFQDIRVPRYLAVTTPKPEKIAKRMEEYAQNQRFNTEIVVDEYHNLVDGYSAYLVAKMLDLPYLLCKVQPHVPKKKKAEQSETAQEKTTVEQNAGREADTNEQNKYQRALDARENKEFLPNKYNLKRNPYTDEIEGFQVSYKKLSKYGFTFGPIPQEWLYTDAVELDYETVGYTMSVNTISPKLKLTMWRSREAIAEKGDGDNYYMTSKSRVTNSVNFSEFYQDMDGGVLLAQERVLKCLNAMLDNGDASVDTPSASENSDVAVDTGEIDTLKNLEEQINKEYEKACQDIFSAIYPEDKELNEPKWLWGV